MYYLLINSKTLSHWNIYDTKEKALDVQKEKLEYDLIVTNKEFEKMQINKYCSKTIEITEKQFFNAFEVLSPMHYTRSSNGDFYFLMREYLTGDITAQYLKQGNSYFTKNVVVSDKETYINDEDISLSGESQELMLQNSFDDEEMKVYEYFKNELNYSASKAEKEVTEQNYNIYYCDNMEDIAFDILEERDDIPEDLKLYINYEQYAELLETSSEYYEIEKGFWIEKH